jgi:hypothetical protein
VFFAIFHQAFVLASWRGELHNELSTRWLADPAFPAYRTLCSILLVARLLLLSALAVTNRGSLGLDVG